MNHHSLTRARRWSGNGLIVLAAVALIGSSFVKIAGVAAVTIPLAKLGFAGDRLRLIALLELASALLFLIPRTRSLGLLLVSAYLGGAIAVHVAHGDPAFYQAAAVLALFWIGAAVRNPEALWSFAEEAAR